MDKSMNDNDILVVALTRGEVKFLAAMANGTWPLVAKAVSETPDEERRKILQKRVSDLHSASSKLWTAYIDQAVKENHDGKA